MCNKKLSVVLVANIALVLSLIGNVYGAIIKYGTYYSGEYIYSASQTIIIDKYTNIYVTRENIPEIIVTTGKVNKFVCGSDLGIIYKNYYSAYSRKVGDDIDTKKDYLPHTISGEFFSVDECACSSGENFGYACLNRDENVFDSYSYTYQRKHPTITVNSPIVVYPSLGQTIAILSGSFERDFNIGNFQWKVEYGSNEKQGKLLSGENKELFNLEWSLTNSDGSPLPVGTYSAKVNLSSLEDLCPERNSEILVKVKSCDSLQIKNFTGSSDVFSPDSGKSLSLNASISGDGDNSIKWGLNIAGRNFHGFGNLVAIEWDGTNRSGRIVPPGKYEAKISAYYNNGDDKGMCAAYEIYEVTVSPSCNLKIVDLQGADTALNSIAGNSIRVYGTISNPSNNPISWDLNILGQSFTGTGTSVHAVWNGKYANGKSVEPGEYSAILTARTADGKCSDSKTINFKVTPSPDEQCSLYVDFGSFAHVANGNMTNKQELFSSRGNAFPIGVTLYYNSLDPRNGALGRGWSHNYDMSLKQNPNGSVLILDGSWRYRYYLLVNGSYIGNADDYASLMKSGNGSFVLSTKDGHVYLFSADGKLSSITDRNGNALTFTYSGNNLSTVSDPSGRSVSFAYDSTNHLTTVTDPASNVYFFTVSGDFLTSVTYSDGGSWHYTYDDNAFMTTKTDPLGNIITYVYDNQHRVVSSTDPEGKTRIISYPQTAESVRSTLFTEKDGGVWGYSYDTEKGYLLSKRDPQGGITSYTYDMAGNRLSTTEPDGSTTTYTYDAMGNMTSITDALGQTTSYTYNQYGQALSVTDPQGNVTGYGYDASGNMISAIDPAGATTKYEYDVKGNVSRVISPLGQATGFTYDQSGNLISMTDAAGAPTSFTYDTAGNMTSQTDAGGSTIRFEYNAKNQLVKMTDSQGNVSIYSYDVSGNKTSETDANGNTTNYEYNYRGQILKAKDALGNATTYGYGGTGCTSCGGGTDKLVSITDANGNITTYEYDQLGRLVKETDPTGNTASYSYDSKGNLANKTDGNGNAVTYSYDGVGRLLKKGYPDGTMELFTYDTKGNILSASNQHIDYAFTYDTNGRMLSVTDSGGRVIQYDYDFAGNKRRVTYPEGSIVSYAYDAAGRLSAITNGGGRTYSFAYDPLGRRSSLTFPNGVITSYSYDTIGRLTDLNHSTSFNGVIASFSYTHDKVGNRLTKTTTDVKYTYDYDAIYQLLQAMPVKLHGRHKEQEHKAENFSYDPVGNRLTGPKAQMTYTYGPGNMLLTANNSTYTYDNNGNLIAKVISGKRNDNDEEKEHSKNHSYTYDYDNRLIKVATRHEDKAIVISFKYDPFGRRIEKKVEEIEDGKREEAKSYTYVYDNEDIILEYFAKAEDRKVKTEVTKYVHGPGIDEPLSIQRKGEIYYYLADGLGSIVALTDNRQKVVESLIYDSFGDLKMHGDKVKNAFTYTGREWDKETGLYYYRARYYDPVEGRFISEDPIPLQDRTQDQLNSYTYAVNNPINFTDPNGQNIYGNWCGPGGSGPTRDGVDAICKKHDNCFSKSGATWKDNVLGTKNKNEEQCIDDCNKDLCNDLRNYFPKTYSEIFGRSAVMLFFRCSN